jgi:hypothetical protein
LAALIPDARAARTESERLRCEIQARKLEVRENAACSREQLRSATEALTRVQKRSEVRLPSPWSSLQWSYDHRVLGDVLVPIP